jgi:hypothetical protein
MTHCTTSTHPLPSLLHHHWLLTVSTHHRLLTIAAHHGLLTIAAHHGLLTITLLWISLMLLLVSSLTETTSATTAHTMLLSGVLQFIEETSKTLLLLRWRLTVLLLLTRIGGMALLLIGIRR